MKLQTSPKLAELTRDQDMVLLHEGCTLTAGEFLELTPAGNAWKVEGLEMFVEDFTLESKVFDSSCKEFDVDIEVELYFSFELENGMAKVCADYKEVVDFKAYYIDVTTEVEAEHYNLRSDPTWYYSDSEIKHLLDEERFYDQLDTFPRVKQVMEILEACQLVDDTTRLAA